MAIFMDCPQCGRKYKLGDESAGRRARCQCGQSLSVPDPAPEAATDPLAGLLGKSLPQVGEETSGESATRPGPAGSRRLTAVVVLALVALLAATAVYVTQKPAQRDGQGSRAEGPAVAAGFATPEDAFDAYKKATIAKDWAAQVRACTPDAQANMAAGAALLAVAGAKADPKLAGILEKHGLDESFWKDVSPASGTAGLRQLVDRFQETIADKAAFYTDVMTEMEDLGAEAPKDAPEGVAAGLYQARALLGQAMAAARLVDVEIRGDVAEAKQALSFMGKTIHLPVRFRRIDEGWLIEPELGIRLRVGEKRPPAP